MKIWLKIAINAVRLPNFEPVKGISWSPRKMRVIDLRQRSGLAWFCACAESCVVFNTGPYTVLPGNSILITANMQSETGFPSSHQLKSYVTSKSRLKLAARAVLSADAGLLVDCCCMWWGTRFAVLLCVVSFYDVCLLPASGPITAPLKPSLHDTTGCPTGWTTGCIV